MLGGAPHVGHGGHGSSAGRRSTAVLRRGDDASGADRAPTTIGTTTIGRTSAAIGPAEDGMAPLVSNTGEDPSAGDDADAASG